MVKFGTFLKNLAILRRAKNYEVAFGADEHRFEMNPCLTEQEVKAFEVEHGVLLPEDYRYFITAVGNGGAGPYYGIARLELAHAFQMVFQCDTDLAIDEWPEDHSTGFPHPFHIQGKKRATSARTIR